MKNCYNCKHRDKRITEEPCINCRFTEYWEFDSEEEFDPEVDNNDNRTGDC